MKFKRDWGTLRTPLRGVIFFKLVLSFIDISSLRLPAQH